MITKELLEFVKSQLVQGGSKENITSMLISQGWSPSDVSEAFVAVSAPVPAPAPAAVPVSASVPSMASMTSMAQPVQQAQRPRSGAGKAIGIAAAVLVLIGAVGWALASYTSVLSSLPWAKPAAYTDALVPATEAQYDKALSQRLSGLEADYQGPYAYAGPVFVALDGSGLRVALPLVPNVVATELSYVDISHIYDASGADINDADSPLNTSLFFKRLQMTSVADPVAHLAGSRSLSLVSDKQDADISKVEGSVVVVLPVGLKALKFKAGEAGKTLSVGASSITLRSVSGGQVDYHIKGERSLFAGVVARDASGAVLSESLSSLQTAGDSLMVDADGSYSFDGTVAEVWFYFSEKSITRSYPFSIAAAQPDASAPTAAAGAPAVSLADKEAAIAGILRTKQALTSGDVQKIRVYMANLAPTPTDKAQLDKMSDQELLSTVKFMELVYDGITAESLRSSGAVWSVKDAATLEVQVAGGAAGGSGTTLSAQKIGGVWY
ncbi:MAG TPA: hypothetical protein VFQ72_03980 [Candidatus Paceibacterota bacterium]|nr:hypothetical protein [Candidatus Paceibacterota bacterium]